MGYYVSYDIDVTIPADKVEACLAAINELHSDENLLAQASGGTSGGDSATWPVRKRKCYSWVTNPPEGEGYKTLKDAFECWRFETKATDNGDVVLEYFTGEKLGDEGNVLFPALAPFVVDGGEIDARGEDGYLWRFLFKDGTMVEQEGKVTYGD